MPFKSVRWFSAIKGCIGIVQTYEDGEYRYFLGSGHGNDEAVDIQLIRNWGSKFPVDAGNILFGVKNENT